MVAMPPTPGSSRAMDGMFQSGVQVFIPAALNRPTHTLYSITMAVQPTAQEWTVNRRYSQFLQLRKDVIAKLSTRGVGCPSCASFHRAVATFAFPRKSLLHTNSVVRRRVTMLQDFLKMLVQRVYNDLPKCAICGEAIQKMMRPFLMRGAQPLHGSILPKIQKSLSLESYAVVPHMQGVPASPTFFSSNQTSVATPQDAQFAASKAASSIFSASCTSAFASSKGPSSSSSIFSMTNPLASSKAPSQASTASDASTQPNESEDPLFTDADEAHYARKYDDQRCNDPTIPLEEAMKQVVMPEGIRSTVEEVVVRLTSMWAAYDMEETLASLPPERLSQRVSISAIGDDEYSF